MERRTGSKPRRGGGSELDRARDELAGRLMESIEKDNSVYAIRASKDMLEWMCDVTLGDPDDTPVTTQSNLRSNWRHWERFCAAAGVDELWRPDVSELTPVGTAREKVLWTSALVWILRNMKPKPGNYIKHGEMAGELQPPKPESALAVLRGIRKEHLDRGITPPPLTLATRRMHELTRRYASWIGPENMVPKRKATLTHQLITGMLDVPDDAQFSYHSHAGGDADGHNVRRSRPWTWSTLFGRSCRTLIHVLAQTGFRKAEVALGNEEWGKMHISWANLTWVIGGVKTASPTLKQLLSLQSGDYAVLQAPPSKADPWGAKWGSHPIYLPYHPTARINAARALGQWEMAARIAPDARRTTPLFCGPDGPGTPLRQHTADDVFHGLLGWHMRSAEAARDYSIHSFRSYLASSMLAANFADAEIQAALRWSSLEALEVYKNTNMERYGGWILAAEQTRLTGMRAVNLPRRLPTCDNIARAQTVIAARRETTAAADVADADRGSPEAAVTLEGRAEPVWRWPRAARQYP